MNGHTENIIKYPLSNEKKNINHYNFIPNQLNIPCSRVFSRLSLRKPPHQRIPQISDMMNTNPTTMPITTPIEIPLPPLGE